MKRTTSDRKKKEGRERKKERKKERKNHLLEPWIKKEKKRETERVAARERARVVVCVATVSCFVVLCTEFALPLLCMN
jgi:hypothetical protein